MKVALITLEGGGISTVCYGLGYSLSKKMIPTTIFTDTSGKSEFERQNEFLDIYRLHRFDIPPRCLWLQVQNFRFLSKKFKDYTLVHGVSPDASVAFTFNKRKLCKPFIASFHAPPLSSAKAYLNVPTSSWTASEVAHNILEYPLHDFTIRRCIAGADHIIICSFTALREFRATYKNLSLEKVSVIYNSVNFDEIEKVKINHGVTEGKSCPSIIFAGRLSCFKGPMYLLEAFKILARDFKDLSLKIYGKGPEENKMKKFVSFEGLRNQVHFYGRVSHKTLIAEIKKSTLVVTPSLLEAQSLFFLEAMACRKPLIAFNIPAAREIIKDGKNGLLARAFDVKDLSEKIRFALTDRKLRLKIAQNAYIYAKREHNWETQIQKYLNIYKMYFEN